MQCKIGQEIEVHPFHCFLRSASRRRRGTQITVHISATAQRTLSEQPPERYVLTVDFMEDAERQPPPQQQQQQQQQQQPQTGKVFSAWNTKHQISSGDTKNKRTYGNKLKPFRSFPSSPHSALSDAPL